MKHFLFIIFASLFFSVLVVFGAFAFTSCTPSGNEETSAPGTNPDPDTSNELSVELYPEPASAVISKKRGDSAPAGLLSPSDRSYDSLFKRRGFSVGEGGLPVEITTDSSLGEEEYRLSVKTGGVTIAANGRAGVSAAISTLSQLCTDGRIAGAEISDKPAVPFRGVIEGFYGEAWTDEYRMELFEFMGEARMNTYIYAPKNDPKHRDQWRTPYTENELEQMSRLVAGARENNVRFVFAISPGKSIDLGSGYSRDLEKLIEKCGDLYKIGVRDFAVFLDDIDSRDHEGHAKLLNDFEEKFIKTHEGCAHLLTVLPEYSDVMLSGYTDKVAPLLSPDIMVMWTGTATTPPSMSGRDLEGINKKLGRSVYIWWNYPVNDMMRDRLFMGPCENLDKKLDRSISGFVSNPMNQGYASMLPLLTTADYLRNPAKYDSERSAKRAAKILEPECPEALLTFMDIMRGSLINGDESSFSFSKELKGFDSGSAASAAKLVEKLEKVSADLALLREKGSEKLLSEISPWLDKAEDYVGASLAFARIYTFESESGRADAALSYVAEYGLTPVDGVKVSEDALVPFLKSVKSRIEDLTGIRTRGVTFENAEAYTDCKAYSSNTVDRINDGDDSTFFWSDGTLFAASGGKVGFVGIKFEGVRKIENIFIATGNEGKDALTNIIIEYTDDGETWREIASGELGETVYLDRLDVSASALRVRNGDTSSNKWVIIRSFEANTDRFADKGNDRVETDLSVYQNYLPENAVDRIDGSFFWSAEAPKNGSYFTVDLGDIVSVTGVELVMGNSAHTSDYIHRGVLEYSTDGVEYVKLCDVAKNSVSCGVPFTARYVRLRCTAAQTNWVIISKFEVKRGAGLPEGVFFDGTVPVDFTNAFDGSVFTVCNPPENTLKGNTLTLDISGKSRVLLCFTNTDGISVRTSDRTGNKSDPVSLSLYNSIDVRGMEKLCISFAGDGAGIAEIVIE